MREVIDVKTNHTLTYTHRPLTTSAVLAFVTDLQKLWVGGWIEFKHICTYGHRYTNTATQQEEWFFFSFKVGT